MTIGDMPMFVGSAYVSQTHSLDNSFGTHSLDNSFVGNSLSHLQAPLSLQAANAAMGAIPPLASQQHHKAHKIAADIKEAVMAQHPARRLVKVIVVDPNENVPLENCILYSGNEKLTDMNDQELYFELDMKSMLAKHNEKRVTFIDKKVKERTEHLEPAKIRDLKMVVVTVASF